MSALTQEQQANLERRNKISSQFMTQKTANVVSALADLLIAATTSSNTAAAAAEINAEALDENPPDTYVAITRCTIPAGTSSSKYKSKKGGGYEIPIPMTAVNTEIDGFPDAARIEFLSGKLKGKYIGLVQKIEATCECPTKTGFHATLEHATQSLTSKPLEMTIPSDAYKGQVAVVEKIVSTDHKKTDEQLQKHYALIQAGAPYIADPAMLESDVNYLGGTMAGHVSLTAGSPYHNAHLIETGTTMIDTTQQGVHLTKEEFAVAKEKLHDEFAGIVVFNTAEKGALKIRLRPFQEYDTSSTPLNAGFANVLSPLAAGSDMKDPPIAGRFTFKTYFQVLQLDGPTTEDSA